MTTSFKLWAVTSFITTVLAQVFVYFVVTLASPDYSAFAWLFMVYPSALCFVIELVIGLGSLIGRPR